jgi:pantetheine-phosphate adenylyltransferase
MKIYVYPGSFDPVTNGHLDIVERAACLCDKLVVAVLINDSKKPYFEMSERVDFIKSAVKDFKNVEVESFSGLLIDFMKKVNASVIIKGLRAVSDFEYELQMALLNKNQNPEIETLFMMTNISYSFLSSSSVRELAKHGGNIDGLVPENIKEKVYQRMSKFLA